ncbi:MAG: ADP-glyceromanno-heptose 6-epimerase [Verrucomicrobiota bacterium]|nr:ADP-glyceromanno-heptose 6-epimerase [Verrucomicrobiota bacterium]
MNLQFALYGGTLDIVRSALITGGAGFIGSNLALELQARYPEAWVVIVDDFRSGDFRNLEGFHGDCIASPLQDLQASVRFKDVTFDAIFHLASITDTTDHDRLRQVRDNVEGFRQIIEWAMRDQTPVIYASSAATYGHADSVMHESTPPSPQNAYAFSKVQLDNLAVHYLQQNPAWRIVGLRYFNVYGPREAHKGHASSMIYQLYRQMVQGNNPRIFTDGEQRRDFVYIKDVVDATLSAVEASKSGIYNIGSGTSASFNDVVAILNSALELSMAAAYFDNPHPFYQNFTQADISAANEMVGYRPAFDLQSGITDYLGWLENGKQGDRTM